MAKTKAAPKREATPAKKTATAKKKKTTAKKKTSKAPVAGSSSFPGFPPDLFQFLAELGLNNEREWFEPRKARYEESVREPALAFIRAMAPRITALSPHFQAIDKKVGGSLMRPYRDVRFSKDKTPYKTNVGIQFRHASGKDVHAPGLYLHLEPGSCFVGGGLWHPDAEPLASIRRRIADEPDAWLRVRDEPSFRRAFELSGESLKRPPRGFDAEHPCIEDLKRKDHVAMTSVSVRMLTSPSALDEITELLMASRNYLRFLCDAVGVAF
ncbi:MAG: DUF2461 domain-containing protein [Nannocystaceae bacterium]